MEKQKAKALLNTLQEHWHSRGWALKWASHLLPSDLHTPDHLLEVNLSRDTHKTHMDAGHLMTSLSPGVKSSTDSARAGHVAELIPFQGPLRLGGIQSLPPQPKGFIPVTNHKNWWGLLSPLPLAMHVTHKATCPKCYVAKYLCPIQINDITNVQVTNDTFAQ